MGKKTSQRGSVSLIAMAALFFLSIVGIGWLPMLDMEMRQAKSDADEQQAWYAAEAGIKYYEFLREKTDYTNAMLMDELNTSHKLSGDDGPTYTLALRNIDGSAIETSVGGDLFLDEDEVYQLLAKGSFNGTTRTITTEYRSPTDGGGPSETTKGVGNDVKDYLNDYLKNQGIEWKIDSRGIDLGATLETGVVFGADKRTPDYDTYFKTAGKLDSLKAYRNVIFAAEPNKYGAKGAYIKYFYYVIADKDLDIQSARNLFGRSYSNNAGNVKYFSGTKEVNRECEWTNGTKPTYSNRYGWRWNDANPPDPTDTNIKHVTFNSQYNQNIANGTDPATITDELYDVYRCEYDKDGKMVSMYKGKAPIAMQYRQNVAYLTIGFSYGLFHDDNNLSDSSQSLYVPGEAMYKNGVWYTEMPSDAIISIIDVE